MMRAFGRVTFIFDESHQKVSIFNVQVEVKIHLRGTRSAAVFHMQDHFVDENMVSAHASCSAKASAKKNEKMNEFGQLFLPFRFFSRAPGARRPRPGFGDLV